MSNISSPEERSEGLPRLRQGCMISGCSQPLGIQQSSRSRTKVSLQSRLEDFWLDLSFKFSDSNLSSLYQFLADIQVERFIQVQASDQKERDTRSGEAL